MSYVSGKLIELASSTIGQRAITVLGHHAKLGQRAKSTIAKSRQRSGLIKQSKKLRNLFKLNAIEAKLKQTTTVANYRPESHTTRE